VILLDTNVLVYATYERSDQHAASKSLVDAVIEGRVAGAIVPQILVEFIAATTGPAIQEQLPLADAVAQVSAFRSQLRTIDPPPSAIDELFDILRQTGRAGRRTFDCFLAAQARALGIETICTYNGDDFAGIARISTCSPDELLAEPRESGSNGELRT
jgi:predicted nucleic acid-binding protein